MFAAVQYVLPHHLISRAVFYFVECQIPWFKNGLIRLAIDHYHVNMSEAKRQDAEEYLHFNDFFTRSLKDGARPLPEDPAIIVSPADGVISQIGDIKNGRIFQAKGHDYSLVELLGGDLDLGQEFMGGKFATIYLAPKDYHRVHIPAAGSLHKMVHVPGRLFSVSQGTVENIPNLFARNERVVSIFDTQYGPMAVIMVGAINVASIETVWAGLVTPQRGQVATTTYGEASQSVELSRGDELGRFKLGSSAIVLFGKNQIEWLKNWQPGLSIKMGEALAQASIDK
nr:archaetidylserine decarboxylase [Endozoicomonas sp. ONNA2]